MGCREARIDLILAAVSTMLEIHTPDLTVIEDYAHSRRTAQSTLGEVGGVIKRYLWLHELPFVEVVSSTVKKEIAGHGRADKDRMIAAVRPWIRTNDDNIADAVALALWGENHYDDLVDESA